MSGVFITPQPSPAPGSGSPDAGDLFLGLAPPTTDDQTNIVQFVKRNEGGGNTVFADTAQDANSADGSTTTISVFNVPDSQSTAAFTQQVLNSLQPGEPQILPDETLTFTSAESQAGAQLLNLSPDQVSQDTKTFGAIVVKAALAQGINPAVLASRIGLAMNNLGMAPPFSSLPQTEQNAFMVEILVSLGNEGDNPQEGAQQAPSKTEAKNIIDQVRAEMDLEQSQGATPYVNQAIASGQDPVQFANLVKQNINTSNPPLPNFTEGQKQQLTYEVLNAETGGDIPDDSVLAQIPPDQRIAFLAKIKAAMAPIPDQGNNSHQNSSVFSGKVGGVGGVGGGGGVSGSGGVGGPSAPNAWLASTPLVAFAIAFLGAIVALMKILIAQGIMTIRSMNRIMGMAKVAENYAVDLANISISNSMASIISSAVAIGCGVISAAAQLHASTGKEEVPEDPVFVADEGPKATLSQRQQSADKANSEISNLTDGKNKAQQRVAEKKDVESTAQSEYEMVHQKQVKQAEKNLADSKDIDAMLTSKMMSGDPVTDADIQTYNLNPSLKDKVPDDDDIKDSNNNVRNNEKELDDAKNGRTPEQLPLQKSIKDAQADRQSAEAEYNATNYQLANRKAQLDNDARTNGFHMETLSEFHAKQARIRQSNDMSESNAVMYGELGNLTDQVANLGTNLQQALNAVEQGNIKGAQALLEGLRQIADQALTKSTSAQSATQDSIDAFIQAYRELGEAVAKAMSEMLQ